jgi:hypothetical protein
MHASAAGGAPCGPELGGCCLRILVDRAWSTASQPGGSSGEIRVLGRWWSAQWRSCPAPRPPRCLPRPSRCRTRNGWRCSRPCLDGYPVLDIVLADLSTDRQHRDTALFLAIVAGRIPVRAALADPDPSIQCRALNAWIRSGVPRADDLAQFLIDAPARARQVAYRSLRRHRSPGIADALIDRVRDRFGDEEAGQLLPVCSSETVARLLPEVGHTLVPGRCLARGIRRWCSRRLSGSWHR